jgi:hypothetical protein
MNLITLVNGARRLVSRIDFIDFANSAFRLRLTGTATADRTISLPDDSGTIQLQDRPIGVTGSGVPVRGWEPIVVVTASKTLALIDSGTVQLCNSAVTITIPLESTVAFAIGSQIILRRNTTSTITIALNGGVTLLNDLGQANTITTVQSFAVIRKIGVNQWSIQNPIQNNCVLPGDPTTTTQSAGNNSTRIATTAFVAAALTNMVRPALEVSRTTTQSVNIGAMTTLIFNTVGLDTNAAYNSATGVFTVPAGQSGLYEFAAFCGFSNPGNNMQIIPVRGGVAQDGLRSNGFSYAADTVFWISHIQQIRLAAGDQFRIDVYYGSISGLATTTSPTAIPSLKIRRIY